MSFSWNNLPPTVSERLFKNFNIRELKTLSFVCRNWLLDIDYYWKKNIIIFTDRIETDEDLDHFSMSNRYLVNIHFGMNYEMHKVRKILQILKNRKGENCDIECLDLFFFRFNDVCEVLKTIWKSPKILFIYFTSNNEDHTIESDISFHNLSSLEELSAYKCPPEFVNLVKYMTNLKKIDLDLFDSNRPDILKTIIENNADKLSSIELEYNSECNEFLKLLSKCSLLESLHLNLNYFEDFEMKTISNNMKYLKYLQVDVFEPNDKSLSLDGVQRLCNLSTLTKLELKNISFDKVDFEIGLKFNSLKNLQILNLNGIHLDDDLGILITQKLNTLKEFRILGVKIGKLTFRFIQEAAENLTDLELLQVQNDFLTCVENLRNGSLATKTFNNLTTFFLTNTSINEHLLKEIKAPNLLRLDLSNCLKLSDETLIVICANFPNLQHLDFYFSRGFSDAGIHELSLKLKYLSVISVYSCTDLTWESVRSVVWNCKYLKEAEFSEIFERTDDKSFETEFKKINEMRKPPLKFNKKNYSEESGDDGRYCKYKLISDTVCVRFSNYRM